MCGSCFLSYYSPPASSSFTLPMYFGLLLQHSLSPSLSSCLLSIGIASTPIYCVCSPSLLMQVYSFTYSFFSCLSGLCLHFVISDATHFHSELHSIACYALSLSLSLSSPSLYPPTLMHPLLPVTTFVTACTFHQMCALLTLLFFLSLSLYSLTYGRPHELNSLSIVCLSAFVYRAIGFSSLRLFRTQLVFTRFSPPSLSLSPTPAGYFIISLKHKLHYARAK